MKQVGAGPVQLGEATVQLCKHFAQFHKLSHCFKIFIPLLKQFLTFFKHLHCFINFVLCFKFFTTQQIIFFVYKFFSATFIYFEKLSKSFIYFWKFDSHL